MKHKKNVMLAGNGSVLTEAQQAVVDELIATSPAVVVNPDNAATYEYLSTGAFVRPAWNDYFLAIAQAVSARADCRRARHGCVIVKNRRIISTGYNGSFPGGPSCLMGECPRGLLPPGKLAHNQADYSNCVSQHAEANAIAYANRDDCMNAIAYQTGPSCDMCSKLLMAAGVIKIVWPGGTVVATSAGWRGMGLVDA
jgi:dCMP deaminase